MAIGGSRPSSGAALAVAAVIAVGLLLILPEAEESVVEDGVAEAAEAAATQEAIPLAPTPDAPVGGGCGGR